MTKMGLASKASELVKSCDQPLNILKPPSLSGAFLKRCPHHDILPALLAIMASSPQVLTTDQAKTAVHVVRHSGGIMQRDEAIA